MVVVLMAVLLVVAAPSMRGMIVDNRINTAIGELANGLGIAKTEAVRINASTMFCVSDERKHWGVALKSAVDALDDESEFASVSLREGGLPDALEVEAEGFSDDVEDYHCLRMRPEGLAYVGASVVGDGVRLTARYGGRARSLTVTPGGLHVDPKVSDDE